MTRPPLITALAVLSLLLPTLAPPSPMPAASFWRAMTTCVSSLTRRQML